MLPACVRLTHVRRRDLGEARFKTQTVVGNEIAHAVEGDDILGVRDPRAAIEEENTGVSKIGGQM